MEQTEQVQDASERPAIKSSGTREVSPGHVWAWRERSNPREHWCGRKSKPALTETASPASEKQGSSAQHTPPPRSETKGGGDGSESSAPCPVCYVRGKETTLVALETMAEQLQGESDQAPVLRRLPYSVVWPGNSCYQ